MDAKRAQSVQSPRTRTASPGEQHYPEHDKRRVEQAAHPYRAPDLPQHQGAGRQEEEPRQKHVPPRLPGPRQRWERGQGGGHQAEQRAALAADHGERDQGQRQRHAEERAPQRCDRPGAPRTPRAPAAGRGRTPPPSRPPWPPHRTVPARRTTPPESAPAPSMRRDTRPRQPPTVRRAAGRGATAPRGAARPAPHECGQDHPLLLGGGGKHRRADHPEPPRRCPGGPSRRSSTPTIPNPRSTCLTWLVMKTTSSESGEISQSATTRPAPGGGKARVRRSRQPRQHGQREQRARAAPRGRRPTAFRTAPPTPRRRGSPPAAGAGGTASAGPPGGAGWPLP